MKQLADNRFYQGKIINKNKGMNEKSNIELKEFCSAAPERLNLFCVPK